LAYECWEASGYVSSNLLDLTIPYETARGSRIDWEWTFQCSGDLRPEDIVKAFTSSDRPSHTGGGVSLGIAGQGGVNTCYVGAASSDRRLRVYRKDLQDKSYKAAYGPCMRVEAVLKGHYAHRAWDAAQSAAGGSYAHVLAKAAAAHIEELTDGVIQIRPDAERPKTLRPATTAAGEAIAAMIRQYWSWLEVCERVGVDLSKLVHQQYRQVGRETEWRHNGRVDQAREVGGDVLTAEVAAILRQ
jgi:hypothetical protein